MPVAFSLEAEIEPLRGQRPKRVALTSVDAAIHLRSIPCTRRVPQFGDSSDANRNSRVFPSAFWSSHSDWEDISAQYGWTWSGSASIRRIAEQMGREVTSLGPIRSSLISKGMIWSPTHGDTAFTVPLFDEFMKRIIPSNEWHKGA